MSIAPAHTENEPQESFWLRMTPNQKEGDPGNHVPHSTPDEPAALQTLLEFLSSWERQAEPHRKVQEQRLNAQPLSGGDWITLLVALCGKLMVLFGGQIKEEPCVLSKPQLEKIKYFLSSMFGPVGPSDQTNEGHAIRIPPPVEPQPAAAGEPQARMLTVSQAAELLRHDVSGLSFARAKARVSRAAGLGKFQTNAQKGTARRIELHSFSTWRLAQREKDLDQYDEQTGNDAEDAENLTPRRSRLG